VPRPEFEPAKRRVFAMGWLRAAAVALLPAWAALADGPRYGADIRPILANKCFKCHGPDEAQRAVGVRLDTADAHETRTRSGRRAIAPGNAGESEILRRILAADPADRMPPPETGLTVSDAEVRALRAWIEAGAVYEPHWSFVPPQAPPLPHVRDDAWGRNEIDPFVLARLEAEGLSPAPEADRTTLLRRVCLDLTGLPPTPAQAAEFLSDSSPDAYERLVDRLLASAAYGERWASAWLDLARYADSQGYEKDYLRSMWRYRDWVIDALNADMPYDAFSRLQLAGDLLPGASVEQRLATAFHRNAMTNSEDGVDHEEFRVAAVVDRVNTTMQVWMGLTVACAQCHTHKYDPIPQRDYYRLFAYFNQTQDTNENDDRPLLATPTPAQRAAQEALEAEAARAHQERESLAPQLDAARSAWLAEAARRTPAIPLAEMTGWFPLDGTFADASGVATESPSAQAALFAPGVDGAAAEFDGKGGVPLAGAGDFERDQAFSITAWVLPRGGGTMVPFARMHDQDNYRGYDLFLHEGRAFVHILNRWPENCIRVNTRATIEPDVWRHFCIVYDGSSRAAGVKIYVDGVSQELDVTHDTLSETIRTAEPLRAGSRQTGHPFKGRVDDVRVYARALGEDDVAALVADATRRLAATPEARRDAPQSALLERIFRRDAAPDAWKAADAAATALDAQLAALRAKIPMTPVMAELPADGARKTHILVGGSHLSPGEEVAPGVLSAFHPLPADAPPNRLGLAAWLFDAANPLTARVAVNRYWEQLFGHGLVETTEDFGLQGAAPSHPELLDWLALRYRDDGWSAKRLLRTIVTSATYRQASSATSDALERDPYNRLLARGPRVRLSAEMLRDQALRVSGLLHSEIGGPSVMPPQPDSIWQVVYSNEQWVTSEGPQRWRRALYTFLRRTSPYPSMILFDATSRETCTARRIRTNTPLQSLVLLNDPVYVEAAQALARLAVREGGASVEDRAAYVLNRALLRVPERAEVGELARLFEDAHAFYSADAEAAMQMATNPLGPVAEGQSAAELAAWTVVCNVVLNLDEFVTKG